MICRSAITSCRDARGRRIQRIISTWNGSVYVAQDTDKFVYDGRDMIAGINTAVAVTRNYLCGLDLSGSLQGAGGVGGLLALNAGTNGVHFCAYDGNGNVSGLVSATNGAKTAVYEYSPFGVLLVANGGFVRNNPIGKFDVLGLACTEAIGKNGKPRIIFTISPSSGGGWSPGKAVFGYPAGGGAVEEYTSYSHI
jgi:hypothetical protein